MQELKQRLTVNLSAATGAVKKGAAGFLYGLGDAGIPNQNILAPLKPSVAAQKPPGGLQHPNGDCFAVAAPFQKAGGKQIQIYLQDIYAQWPYETQDIQEYLCKVDSIADAVMNHPSRAIFAYVPFNEPDAIWFNAVGLKEAFFAAWKTVYQKIRARDSAGPIVGPNTTKYRAAFFEEFMAFCRTNDCLPDVISWHELESDFFSHWYHHLQHYRNLEKILSLPDLPVCINEYGCWRDLSVPGRLVQWIARLENSKVDGCLAYWHAAGNLDDLATQNNHVTGAWWLFQWYGALSGDTVEVIPPDPDGEGLQGLAALDREKRQVRLVCGGGDGSCDIVIQGFDAISCFGGNVHVKAWSVAWSGYEGPSAGPAYEMEGDYPVVHGAIRVTIDAMEGAAAYLLIVTESAADPEFREHKPRRAAYEAEEAERTDCAVVAGGTATDPNRNYQSNNLRVAAIENETSRVRFAVDAPADGDYLLNIFYGNGHGSMAQQLFRVDDGTWSTLEYYPNLAWGFTDIKTVPCRLTRGSHNLTFAKSDPAAGSARLSVDLDKIELVQLDVAPPMQRFEAIYAEVLGEAEIRFDGAGYVAIGKGKDSGVRFITNQTEHGLYQIAIRCLASFAGTSPNPAIGMDVNGLIFKLPLPGGMTSNRWADAGRTVFLCAGINRITFYGNDSEDCEVLGIESVAVSRGDGSREIFEAEAPQNTLSGTVRIFEDPYASGGKYAGHIGNGAVNALQFNAVKAAVAGIHPMAIYYANAEKAGHHQYNVNIVDRYADINVNGGGAQRVYFRNTYGWNAYRSVVVPVELIAGDNTIRFFNDAAAAPHIDKIEISRMSDP